MENIFDERKLKVKNFKGVVRHRSVSLKEVEVPEGLFKVCPKCDGHMLDVDLVQHLHVCVHCGHHLPLTGRGRLDMLVDKGDFRPLDEGLSGGNPLDMPGYDEKLQGLKAKEMNEAVITGIGKIAGYTYGIGVMDNGFLMGSMGTAVGEKLVNLIEFATQNRLPLCIVSTSGGARMQEGILSLMQMAKTTAALARHHDAGLFYLSLLTSPTYGGVSASFATVADIILAEPEALIGFAGPRVIKQTIGQVLPKGFQSAEFLLEKGHIDAIVPRGEWVKIIGQLSKLHNIGGEWR